jgi:hypothetical protein
MSAVDDDIGAYLAANGQSAGLVYGGLDSSPAAQVAVVPGAGRPPEWTHNQAGTAINKPSVQVLVRAADYRTARDRANAIHALLQLTTVTIGSTVYHRVWPIGSPAPLGPDDNGWFIFSVNFITDQKQ